MICVTANEGQGQLRRELAFVGRYPEMDMVVYTHQVPHQANKGTCRSSTLNVISCRQPIRLDVPVIEVPTKMGVGFPCFHS